MCFTCGKSECKRGSVCTIVGELKPLNVWEMAVLKKPMERTVCACGSEGPDFVWFHDLKISACFKCAKEIKEKRQ